MKPNDSLSSNQRIDVFFGKASLICQTREEFFGLAKLLKLPEEYGDFAWSRYKKTCPKPTLRVAKTGLSKPRGIFYGIGQKT